MSNVPQQRATRSIGDDISQWWRDCPIVNKMIIVLSSTIYFLGFVNPIFIYSTVNIPQKTVLQFNIWRLITAPFSHKDIIQLLFGFMSLIPMTKELEKQIGSTAFFGDLMWKNLMIQLGFALTMLLLSFLQPIFAIQVSQGLWQLVMVYLTIRCMSNPEQDTPFLCFPVMIKQKWYPVLILMFMMLLGGPQLDMIFATLVGFMEFKYYGGMFIRLTKPKVITIENSYLSCIKDRSDFISCQNVGSLYYDFNSPSQQGGVQTSNQYNNSDRQNHLPRVGQVQQVEEFKGSGVTLGSGTQQALNITQQNTQLYTQEEQERIDAFKSRQQRQQQMQNSQQHQQSVSNDHYQQLNESRGENLL